MPSKFANYHLMVGGTHVASFQHFGDVNRAAFDDIPGFEPEWAGAAWELPRNPERLILTEVVARNGVTLAAYELRRGRLARPVDVNDERLLGASHIPGRFAAE